MPENSIEGVLKKFFSDSTRSDWKKTAMQETGGKDPFEILSWRGKDEILFLPYYDAADVANLKSDAFGIPATEVTFSGPGGWINLPCVNITPAGKANSAAIDHLASGADGIFFDLRNETDLRGLLQNIQWPSNFLAFQIHDDTSASSLTDLISRQPDPASLHGALFWESIPKRKNMDFYFQHCAHVKCLGLIIPATSPAVEICHALTLGVQAWETYAWSDADQVLRSISFSLFADSSILETMAKIKALRMLWVQVALAYGINDYKGSELHVHMRSTLAPDGHYTPHENMLKGTFAAMAAVMGGCNSLTVIAEQEPAIIPRWARNVSTILKEESFFNRLDAPVAGSYAVDSMADEIAKRAWQLFQTKMKEA